MMPRHTGPEVSADASNIHVLVTGAARGIGLATANTLIKANATVAALDRDASSFEVAPGCEQRGTDRLRPFVCDLTRPSEVEACFAEICAWTGHIDVVVHCAGIGRYAPFLELSDADWEGMLQVNVLAVARLTRLALPAMIARGSGQVIIVGSRRGTEPNVETSAYSATKAAVLAMARGLALEVSELGVHVCLLAPGGVRTSFGGVDPATKDPRFIEPDTIAQTILYMIRHRGNAWVRDVTLLPLGL